MIDKRRKMTFVPRFSIYNVAKKIICFNMLQSFDFSSIENIIKINFISPIVKTVSILFSISKGNSVKLNEHKAGTKIAFKLAVNNNDIKPINKIIADLMLYFYSKPIINKHAANAVIGVKLIAKSKLNSKLITEAKDRLVLCGLGRIIQKYTNIINAFLHLKAIGNARIFILHNALLTAIAMLSAQSSVDDKPFIVNDTAAKIKLSANNSNVPLMIGSKASAVVYRSALIGDLYNTTLAELYGQPLSELYGIELK